MEKSHELLLLRIRTVGLQRVGILILKGKDFFKIEADHLGDLRGFLSGLFQQRLRCYSVYENPHNLPSRDHILRKKKKCRKVHCTGPGS